MAARRWFRLLTRAVLLSNALLTQTEIGIGRQQWQLQ